MLSSATNFGGSALAAGLLTPTGFGAFALAITIYVFALQISRAWNGHTILMIAPGEPESRQAIFVASAFRLSWRAGAVVGAAMLLVGGLFRDTPLGPSLIALGFFLPALLGQDALRMGMIATGRANQAVISDLSWLVTSTTLLMVLRLTDTASSPLAVAAWASGSVVGILALAPIVRAIRSAADVWGWLRTVQHAATRLSVEAVVSALGGFILLVAVVAAVFGVDEAGGVRAAQVIMGPTVVAHTAFLLHYQPLVTERVRRGEPVGSLRSRLLALNIGLTAVWFALAVSTPRRFGTRVFGESWDPAQDDLRWIGLAYFGLAVYLAATTELRGRQLVSTALRARMIAAVIVVTATALGSRWGSDGVIIGFSVGTASSALIPWLALARRHRGG